MDCVGQLPMGDAAAALSAFKAFSRSTLRRSCSVCGKMATGIHYMVMSCNGCRSFFRRTIALNRHYKCKRAGSNRMECFKRYDCKLCRMKLCLAAGMDAERVIINEESEERTGCDVAQARLIGKPSAHIELKPDKMMDNLLAIENAHDSVRVSSFGNAPTDEFPIDQPDQSEQSTSTRAQFDPVAIQILPTELVIKYKLDMDFSDFDYARNRLWIFQDIIYSMEFMKALPIYYLLDDCSKRVLISSLVACCNLSTAFYAYRHDSANYHEQSCSNAEIEAQSTFSSLFNTGIMAVIREVQLAPREFIMLKMILVCNPTLEVMSAHDATLIQHEKERCTKALLSFVMKRIGVKEGPAVFAKILSIVDVVIRLTTMEKGHHILMLARGRHVGSNRIPLLPNQSFSHTHAVADVAM